MDGWSDRGAALSHQMLICDAVLALKNLSTLKQVIKISNNLSFWMMSAFNSLARNFFTPSSEILLLNEDQKTFKSDCELL